MLKPLQPSITASIAASITSVLAVGTTLIAPFCLSRAAIAQYDSNPVPYDDIRQNNERDPLMGQGNGVDMYDLIHRSNLGTIDMQGFVEGQGAEIHDATSSFRAMQLQRLQQAQPIATPTGLTTLHLSE